MRNFITILLVLSSPTMVAPTSVNLIPIELPVKKEVVIITA